MAHITLRAVNAAIKKEGGTAQLINGGGYFYFAEGEADNWHADSIYTMYLNDYTLEEWLGEYRDRRDAYQREQKENSGTQEQTIHRERAQDDARDGESSKEHGNGESAAAEVQADVSDEARAGRELAAMTDTARLDFLIAEHARVERFKEQYRVAGMFGPLCDWRSTAREAIDAAMNNKATGVQS
jgi:hypothetical protein